MKKPRCFVAMAFGRDDTDVLYNTKILPVLKRNGVTAVIINRRKSLDDVNKQIIEQLDVADLCIADLTYERPSVYFEAGYAQRVVPVIYTCRKDHIAPQSSLDGRVHFDLTMKPLVEWKNPNDKTFAKRLETLLRVAFLSQWKRKQQASDALDKVRLAFGRLSLGDRISMLKRSATHAFKRLGFSRWQYEKTPDHTYRHLVFDDGTGYSVGERRRDNDLVIVKLKVLDSLTKRRLEHLLPDLKPDFSLVPHRQVLDDAAKAGFRPSRLAVHCLVIVLQKIKTVQLETVLNMPAGERPSHYIVTSMVDTEEDRRVPTVRTLDCIAPVKSEADLRSTLRTLIPQMLLAEDNS